MLAPIPDPELPTLRDAWETNAHDWAAWASTPDHDHFFWHYNPGSTLRRR